MNYLGMLTLEMAIREPQHAARRSTEKHQLCPCSVVMGGHRVRDSCYGLAEGGRRVREMHCHGNGPDR